MKAFVSIIVDINRFFAYAIYTSFCYYIFKPSNVIPGRELYIYRVARIF